MGEKKSKEWYDAELKGIGMKVFNTGIHEQRGLALAALIAKDNPKKIFEFAAGGSILAKKVLFKLTSAHYYWTDFSTTALDDAKIQLKGLPVTFWDIDIDKLYRNINWNNYDAVVCVSMEHLENDREILNSIPPKKKVYLSIPNIDAPDHIRVLKTSEEIIERYSDLLKIESITNCTNFFKLVVATKL